jgi:hypothetical protein
VLRWEGHVTSIGKMRNAYSSYVWKPEGIRLLGIPRHIHGRITLKWIFKKQIVREWAIFIWLRI